MRVSSRDDQRQHWKLQLVIALLALFEQHGVNVAFEMVDRDQRFIERESQSFGVTDAHEKRPGKTRPLRDGDGVD